MKWSSPLMMMLIGGSGAADVLGVESGCWDVKRWRPKARVVYHIVVRKKMVSRIQGRRVVALFLETRG